MAQKIIPILMAGGAGTRLWPLSRKSHPKQFSKIIDEKTLFQNTVLRITSNDAIKFAPPITLTNNNYVDLVKTQFSGIDFEPGPIIAEPEMKNTAPAILAATIYAESINADTPLLFAPTDHLIANREAFLDVVSLAYDEMANDKIVSFGIAPKYPATGFGYIQVNLNKQNQRYEVTKFIEKPNELLARQLLEKGNVFWNAGIFMFKPSTMIEAFQKYAPELYEHVYRAVHDAKTDDSTVNLEPSAWSSAPNVSIDYAIMEFADNIVTVPFFGEWSDLGGWDTVWENRKSDQHGVVTTSNSHSYGCQNTLLQTEQTDQQLVGLGLENLIVVAASDAILVANKDKAQEVKSIVSSLAAKNIKQADTFPIRHLAWGHKEIIKQWENFNIERWSFNPKSEYVNTSENILFENWIVIGGEIHYSTENESRTLLPGDTAMIQSGSQYTLKNNGNTNSVLIKLWGNIAH